MPLGVVLRPGERDRRQPSVRVGVNAALGGLRVHPPEFALACKLVLHVAVGVRLLRRPGSGDEADVIRDVRRIVQRPRNIAHPAPRRDVELFPVRRRLPRLADDSVGRCRRAWHARASRKRLGALIHHVVQLVGAQELGRPRPQRAVILSILVDDVVDEPVVVRAGLVCRCRRRDANDIEFVLVQERMHQRLHVVLVAIDIVDARYHLHVRADEQPWISHLEQNLSYRKELPPACNNTATYQR